MDHSIGLIILMIDFHINCIPFMARHQIFSIIISGLYLIMNASYSVKMKPIYPFVDYQSVAGIIAPCAAVIWGFIMVFLLLWYSDKKYVTKEKLDIRMNLEQIKD
jgi:hypothetical protein